ncbi:MAG: DUF1285 domain-containing protein [Hyphomicrobiales bacterium]
MTDDTKPVASIDGGEISGGLEALLSRAKYAGSGMPPVEKWNPPFCGDLDMRIARDGLWYYMGTPIGREALVRLFSTVLRKDEDGKTYLVTPVEKIGIQVDDAPFVAVEMTVHEEAGVQALTLRTNVGDVVEVGDGHPLRFDDEDKTEGVKPYVHVRGRLDALLARPLLYQLVDLGETRTVDGVDMFGVTSRNIFFAIMRQDELDRLSEAD